MKATITQKIGKLLSHSDEVSVMIDGIEHFTGNSSSIFDAKGREVASLRETSGQKKSWFSDATGLWIGEKKVGELIVPGWAWKPLTLQMDHGQVSFPRSKGCQIGSATVTWVWPKVLVQSESHALNQEFLLAILVGYYLRTLEFTGS